jgi:hypothetical protein
MEVDMTKTEARKADLAYTKALNEGRVVRIGYGATFKTFNTADEAKHAVTEYRTFGMPANVVGEPQ